MLDKIHEKILPATYKILPPTLERELYIKKVTLIALTILTGGIYLAGRLLLNEIKVRYVNALFLPATLKKPPFELPDHLKKYRIHFHSLDGNFLEGGEYVRAKNRRWMVYLNGNRTLFEERFEERIKLANALDVNLLTFNYRDVGKSEGRFTQVDELVIDGASAIEYLKKRGVDEKDIILYGHSLGGGILKKLMIHYTKLRGVSDRSFHKATATLFGIVGKMKQLFAQAIGYDIDVIRSLRTCKDRCLFIYHKHDPIVDYDKASFYKAAKERIYQNEGRERGQKPIHIKLRTSGTELLQKGLHKKDQPELPDIHSYSVIHEIRALGELKKFVSINYE